MNNAQPLIIGYFVSFEYKFVFMSNLLALKRQLLVELEEDKLQLTPEQESILDKDLAASELEENLVSHEEALQVMSKWLKE
jgi:hypothetical protein